MYGLFNRKFFSTFPEYANDTVLTELLTTVINKRRCVVRLLFSCSMETLVNSLHCFPVAFCSLIKLIESFEWIGSFQAVGSLALIGSFSLMATC